MTTPQSQHQSKSLEYGNLTLYLYCMNSIIANSSYGETIGTKQRIEWNKYNRFRVEFGQLHHSDMFKE